MNHDRARNRRDTEESNPPQVEMNAALRALDRVRTEAS
jgi:hypothetical protein